MAGIPTEASILDMVERAMPGRLLNVNCAAPGGGKLMAVLQFKKSVPSDEGRQRQAALLAFAAEDGEGNDHAFADAKRRVLLADFYHLAHEFVAHDVAGLHPGHEAVKQMQIRAAYRARRDLYDRVAWVFDYGIRNRVVLNIMLAMPSKCFHSGPLWVRRLTERLLAR